MSEDTISPRVLNGGIEEVHKENASIIEEKTFVLICALKLNLS